MSSTRMQMPPSTFADDVGDFGFARPLAALVDNGERCIDAFGESAGAHHATDVRRHDDHFGELEALLDVAHDDRRGEQIVGRDIEEALDLAGMQIECEHAIGAGMGDQIGDELRRNRRARPDFAVLPGIAEIGDHRGDAPRRRAAQRVDNDQQFHQMVVGGIRGRLDDEDVGAADVFLNLDEHFHIGEAAHHRFGQWVAEIGADRVRERRVGIAGDELDCSVIARHSPFSSRADAQPDLIQAAFHAGNTNSKSFPAAFSAATPMVSVHQG